MDLYVLQTVKKKNFKNLSFLKLLFQDIKADAMAGNTWNKKGQWEGPQDAIQ